uniref:Gastrin/cholecystokinin peptide hormone domain-containing protein n=2 Tax=Takifugu rubripes TaxID=31033 RepID=A0A674MCA0_TAKRU|eukprot:XP_011616016.1 PREDICTED: gastrin/cholecystokinin-like peptide [Takifugu rubripes]
MSGKDVMAVALLAVLLIATAASSAGNTKKTDVLQKLLTKMENVRMLRGKQQQESQPDLARVERRAQLSDDEREIMTKQIMQALSEMMNTDCMLDRDYQGWVDFGRRDAK